MTSEEIDHNANMRGMTSDEFVDQMKQAEEAVEEAKKITEFVDSKLDEIFENTGLRCFVIALTSEANTEDQEVFHRRYNKLSYVEAIGLKKIAYDQIN